MVEWHGKSRRKPSGGLRRSMEARHKHLSERGGDIALTRVIEHHQQPAVKAVKGMGNTVKAKALRIQFANVTIPTEKKTKKMEVSTVKQNEANKLFVRRNIITQNAIIEVKDGGAQIFLARVTSRPGQSGSVEAVLLSPEETKAFEETTKKTVASTAEGTMKKVRKPKGGKKPKKAAETAPEPVEAIGFGL